MAHPASSSPLWLIEQGQAITCTSCTAPDLKGGQTLLFMSMTSGLRAQSSPSVQTHSHISTSENEYMYRFLMPSVDAQGSGPIGPRSLVARRSRIRGGRCARLFAIAPSSGRLGTALCLPAFYPD